MTNLDSEIRIYQGHDWPFKNGNLRALDLIRHHNQRLEILLSNAQKKPLTVSDGIDLLFNKRFESHELFFAAGESRAHLNHLSKQNKVKKDTINRNGQEIDIFYV